MNSMLDLCVVGLRLKLISRTQVELETLYELGSSLSLLENSSELQEGMRKKSEGSRDATAFMTAVKPPIVARKGSDHRVSVYVLKRIGKTPVAPILNLSDPGQDFKRTLMVGGAEVLNEVEFDRQGSAS